MSIAARLPGIRPGTAQHGTAWHTAAVPRSLGSRPQLLLWGHARGQSRAQGAQAGAWRRAGSGVCRAAFVLGGGCMCAAVCLCTFPLRSRSLPESFCLLRRHLPALVVFPLFYSGCTCANKTLPGAKLPSCEERRSCACSPPRDAPSLPQHPLRSGQGVPAGTSPAQKLVLQSLFPKGGTAENAACLRAAKCPGCRQPPRASSWDFGLPVPVQEDVSCLAGAGLICSDV